MIIMTTNVSLDNITLPYSRYTTSQQANGIASTTYHEFLSRGRSSHSDEQAVPFPDQRNPEGIPAKLYGYRNKER